MANPTLMAFSEADPGTGTASTETSASLTWQVGDIIVLIAGTSGGNESFNAPTNTGSGLSWVQQQLHNGPGGAEAGIAGWTAVATAASSGTVSANLTVADQLGIGVFQVRAPAGYTIAVGNSQIGWGLTGGTETISLTVSQINSMVVWGASDANADTPVGSGTPTPTTHSSSSPGPTALPFANRTTASAFYFDDVDDQVATGAQSFGYSGMQSTALTSIVAVEIKLTPAARQFVPHRMPLGA